MSKIHASDSGMIEMKEKKLIRQQARQGVVSGLELRKNWMAMMTITRR